MTLTQTHLDNARTHALQDQENATLSLGRALGKLEFIQELEGFLALPEPESDEAPAWNAVAPQPPAPEAPDCDPF